MKGMRRVRAIVEATVDTFGFSGMPRTAGDEKVLRVIAGDLMKAIREKPAEVDVRILDVRDLDGTEG